MFQKLSSLDKGSVWVILAVLSALFSYLVIAPPYFPSLGWALSLGTLSTLVMILKENKTRFDRVLYSFTIILSFFIVFRANEFITFLNIIAMFFLGSLLILSRKEETRYGFLDFFLSPLTLFLKTFSIKSTYALQIDSVWKNNVHISQKRVSEVLLSLGVSFVILLVIIPLLASANPIFGKLIGDILGIFNLQTWLQWMVEADRIVLVIRSIFFLVLLFFIPRMLTYLNKPMLGFSNGVHQSQLIGLILPKIIVSAVLLVFFITQAQLYFASNETLLALGYSHSDYAREVFGQLTVVALVILAIIYNDKDKKTLSTYLTYILVLEGFFLAGIALKSVYDYSATWGLTHKRLWGYTGVFWITGVFGLFLYTYLGNLKNNFFVRRVILFSALTLAIVNMANFDALIFHYRKSVTHEGMDYIYLSSLSADAQSYKEQLDLTENRIVPGDKTSIEHMKARHAQQVILYRIEDLQRKYKTIDIRHFNISEYAQYMKIKSIDTEKLQEVLDARRPGPEEPDLYYPTYR